MRSWARTSRSTRSRASTNRNAARARQTRSRAAGPAAELGAHVDAVRLVRATRGDRVLRRGWCVIFLARIARAETRTRAVEGSRGARSMRVWLTRMRARERKREARTRRDAREGESSAGERRD